MANIMLFIFWDSMIDVSVHIVDIAFFLSLMYMYYVNSVPDGEKNTICRNLMICSVNDQLYCSIHVLHSIYRLYSIVIC